MASGLFLAVMAAAILTTAIYPSFGHLQRGAIWGGVVLVSAVGWGALVERIAFPGRKADSGLRLSWGLAVLVAIGGLLCLAALATRSTLLALVVLGVVATSRDIAIRSALRPRLSAAMVAWLPIAALVGIQWYGGAAGARLSANDDFTAYLAYPEEILASGTLLEPFSVRRMAAYGGHSLLQAFTLIGAGDVTQVPLLDIGICLVALIALVVGQTERRALAAWWLVPVALVLTLPNIRYNSSSHMSGAVFFLALYRTAAWSGLAQHPLRGRAVVGMLAAAAGTLRQSYLVAAVAFIVLLGAPEVLRVIRLRGAERGQRLIAVAIAPAAMLVCLLAWMLLSQRSSGTPLFPLVSGNYRPEHGQFTAPNAVMDRAAWLWVNLRHCHPVRSIPLFLLAVLVWPWRRTRGALAAVTGASVLGFLAIVHGFPQADEWNMARYYFALVVATTLAVTLEAGTLRWSSWRTLSRRETVGGLLVLAAIVFQIAGVLTSSYGEYRELVALVREAPGRERAGADEAAAYRALQSSLPAGAPVLAMLDRPYRLDFGRNPIDLVDLPGHASPPPGMPLDDDEEMAAYLEARGIRHLACVRPSASLGLYRRARWEKMLAPGNSGLWREAAPGYLRLFDRIDGLMRSRTRLYDDGKMVAIDLASRGR